MNAWDPNAYMQAYGGLLRHVAMPPHKAREKRDRLLREAEEHARAQVEALDLEQRLLEGTRPPRLTASASATRSRCRNSPTPSASSSSRGRRSETLKTRRGCQGAGATTSGRRSRRVISPGMNVTAVSAPSRNGGTLLTECDFRVPVSARTVTHPLTTQHSSRYRRSRACYLHAERPSPVVVTRHIPSRGA